MKTLRTSRVLAAAAVLAVLALILRTSVGMTDGLDYFTDASYPIDALASGNLRSFAANPALMGDFSLYLRAPFVLLVFKQDVTIVYLVGALPCLAALVALALYLRRRMTALGRPAAAAGLVALLAVLNPGTFRSLHWGHPEEFLAAALCVGAVLAALRGRSLLAGVLLGLAVATKQWALIAVIPTLLAATEQRVRLGLVAGALAVAIALPSLLLQPQSVVAMHTEAIQAPAVTAPASVWWPFSTPRTAAERKISARGFAAKIPSWMGAISHPLIVLIGVPLAWLFWRRRARLTPEDVLGLLALLMLLRCLLDPWNNDYYHAPFLLALLSWEAMARDGWPRLTLFASAALALTFPATLDTMSQMSADSLRYCVTYLVWALPLAGWLIFTLFVRREPAGEACDLTLSSALVARRQVVLPARR